MPDPVDTDALRDIAKIRWSDIMSWCNDAVQGIEDAADEVDRLRAVIENAPHGSGCRKYNPEHRICTCFKADAL
jgi:hypothetical protein